MSCSTGKSCYFTEEEVREALIRSQIRFLKAASNYYQCNDCGEYHLTSRGGQHPVLSEPAVQKRIKQERQSQDWEERFRR